MNRRRKKLPPIEDMLSTLLKTNSYSNIPTLSIPLKNPKTNKHKNEIIESTLLDDPTNPLSKAFPPIPTEPPKMKETQQQPSNTKKIKINLLSFNCNGKVMTHTTQDHSTHLLITYLAPTIVALLDTRHKVKDKESIKIEGYQCFYLDPINTAGGQLLAISNTFTEKYEITVMDEYCAIRMVIPSIYTTIYSVYLQPSKPETKSAINDITLEIQQWRECNYKVIACGDWNIPHPKQSQTIIPKKNPKVSNLSNLSTIYNLSIPKIEWTAPFNKEIIELNPTLPIITYCRPNRVTNELTKSLIDYAITTDNINIECKAHLFFSDSDHFPIEVKWNETINNIRIRPTNPRYSMIEDLKELENAKELYNKASLYLLFFIEYCAPTHREAKHLWIDEIHTMTLWIVALKSGYLKLKRKKQNNIPNVYNICICHH